MRLGALVALLLTFLSVTAAPADAATVTRSTIWTTIGTTNVTPMWGPQVPKVVYDAPSGWYYTSTFDGNGQQYPWLAKLWKSKDGVNWTLARFLGGLVRMPPALILDSGNRLWFVTTCEPGPDQCWQGAPAPGNRYTLRLQFTHRLADGSFDFEQWNDYSTRAPGYGDRTYVGVSIDRDRRYIYQAYSQETASYGFFMSRFDTFTNTENIFFLAQPGANEGYYYPRVRPGTTPGEVWLLFNQTTIATMPGQNNAMIHGVQLWRSTDYGQSFQSAQRTLVTSSPGDGVDNWCDASDLVVDANDVPHVLYYQRISGVSHLRYWKGSAGSVVLTGSPSEVGALDNHAQLQISDTGERFVFGEDYGTIQSNQLRVKRSTNGVSWSSENYTIPGVSDMYSPNLMRRESGSFPAPGTNKTWSMLLSGKPTGSSVYSRLDFLTYTG